MKRREFIRLLGGATVASPLPLPFAWPFVARAQDPAGGVQAGADAAGAVGQVATVQGSATVTRTDGKEAIALQINHPIFKNDVLATAANSSLGVTFDDQTTFSLSANTRIVVNEYVYQEGGHGNFAAFDVAAGTAAFVASLVAKTGYIRVTTPVGTLGIRGTTGVVEVPESGAAGEPKIKLYADVDGHVGRIEVFNPQGARLGALTLSASAFTLRLAAGGQVEALPYQIPPQEAARDRLVLQRLFVSHNIGRRKAIERARSRGRHQQQQPGRGNPHEHGHGNSHSGGGSHKSGGRGKRK
jgi:FecR protein